VRTEDNIKASNTSPARIFEILLLAALSFLVFALFQDALFEIAEICWENDDYSHGLILPFIIGYIWWDQKDDFLGAIRKRIPGTDFDFFIPLLLLIPGLMLLLLGYASRLNYLSWIAFFPVVISIVWLVFGRTVFLYFWGPFLLLVMAKPLPDSVVVRLFWPLQVLAAQVGAKTLELLQVPVYLSGNIIELPGVRLMVEEACSGMRSVMALLTLAFIMTFFMPLSYIGKLFLVIASLLLALCINIFRVALTGVLSHFYSPEAATGFFHTFSGLIVFVVGLPLIFLVSSFLSRLPVTGNKREKANE
jgi:exosortase